MKYKITLILFLSIFSLAYGQSKPKSDFEKYFSTQMEMLSKTDPANYAAQYTALEEEVKNRGDKDQLLDLYLIHSEYLLEKGNYDSLLKFLHHTKNLKKKESDSDLLPVYLLFGSVFHFKANLDSLSFWQNKVAQMIDSNSPYYGQYLLNEGLKSQLNADYNKAIEAIIEAAKMFEGSNDLKRLAVAYNNLAFNYERFGNHDAHVEYLLRAVSLNKILGNSYNLAMNYNNLGLSFRENDLLDEAVAFYDSAFWELEKVNSPLLLAQNLMNRANIYKRKGDLIGSEPFFLQSLAICKENGILYGQMLCELNLGDLYRQMRRFDLSLIHLQSAFELSKNLKAKREEALIYERFSWVARDRGDYTNAYDWQSKFHSLNDSLVNESVKKESIAMREKYETEKKEKEILNLSKEKLYQQFIIAVAFLVVLFLFVLFQGMRSKYKLSLKERQKEELKRKYLDEVLQTKNLELTNQVAQLIQIQEQIQEEKSKILNVLKENQADQKIIKKTEVLFGKNSLKEVKSDFDLRLTASNEDFFKILLQKYPDLKPAELKLCAYLRLNLPTKDLALMLNRSVRTIESSRTIIRQKMHLDSNTNLVTHLLILSNKMNEN